MRITIDTDSKTIIVHGSATIRELDDFALEGFKIHEYSIEGEPPPVFKDYIYQPMYGPNTSPFTHPPQITCESTN